MEKRKICKICEKSYSNGKALGGHMRSHFAIFPLPRKSPTTAITRRRSDRRRRIHPEADDDVEEAARFLMELSRDTWRQSREIWKQRYVCDICQREFRSHQALGGHKANHKKVEDKVFECEFCYKVFESGQALGGHKKSHFSTHLPRNAFGGTLVIDLNFPVPGHL